MKLDGASAMVVGGGGLLGAATVGRLLEHDVSVLVADLTPGKAQALLSQYPGRTAFAPTDVTNPVAVQTALDLVEERGTLRLVVNCAGAGMIQRTLSKDGQVHDLQSFRAMIELNLIAAFSVLSLAASVMAQHPPLADGERGVIVNTASLAGLEGSTGQAAYGAAKAGVAGLTLPAARDLAPVGIRVMTIAPGGMLPPDHVDQNDPRTAALLANVPHPRRFGLPEEYALLVTQIVENSYLNGSIIRLDGAARLGLKY